MPNTQKDYNQFFKDLNDVIGRNPKSAYAKRKYVKSGKYSKKPVVKTLRDEFAMHKLLGLFQTTFGPHT